RDLDKFVREYTPTLALLDRVKMADFRDAHHILLNWARALQGRGSGGTSLSDPTFDEDRFFATHQGEAAFFLTFIYAARLHLALTFDDAPAALAAARAAREVAVGGTMWPVLIDFWGGLAAARVLDDAPEGEGSALRSELDAARRLLDGLAASCP